MAAPLALIICDGWGLSASREYNAIALAHTPHVDALVARWPHTRLNASGLAVGLPEGRVGNSEVGHTNMGAGRVVYQELTRIDAAIRDGSFYQNSALVEVVDAVKHRARRLHLIGLLSEGGVHSSFGHLVALLRLANRRGCREVFVHAFLDGRDAPPKSAKQDLRRLEAVFQEIGVGRLGTVCGRYYAMDRDRRYDRTAMAYRALVDGQGEVADAATTALDAYYARGITDEFVPPTILDPGGILHDGDGVIVFNFRPDRIRQLVAALTQGDFEGFQRGRPPAVHLVGLTEYDPRFGLEAAFPPQALSEDLASVLASRRIRQFRAAETEKYAHVTYFFNCGREAPHPLEDRVLIPSPKVATYDLVPHMAALAVASAAAEAITAGKCDVAVVNFANADMVGHTGNLEAAVRAVEAVDAAVGRVVQAVNRMGGVALITADHGNAEQMRDPETGAPHTAHTSNPVPFIVAGKQLRLKESGILADVAPTVLELLGIPAPQAMTARSLIIH